MESIGEKLRLARERNNLTIDQVARETHVAKRFLKALEDEEFSAFPGETYAMGFLRNYADYLGLNAEELIGTYRNIRIQEQPLPMNELLDSHPARPSLRLIVIIAAAAIGLAVAGYLIYRVASRGGNSALASRTPSGASGTDYVLQDDVRTQWFGQGEGIAIPIADKTYRVVVSAIGDSLTLKVPGGTVDLGLGKERYIDLDGDSQPDLRIVWNDVDRGAPQKRVLLGLYRVTGQAPVTADAGAAGAGSAVPPAVPGATSAPPVRTATFAPVVLTQAALPGLFTLDFTFRGDCLFRFLVDDNPRQERFFQNGEQLTIDSAKRQVTIWLSNADAARVRVQGKDFELGRPGEVATRMIAWRKDASSGGYVLEIVPLY